MSLFFKFTGQSERRYFYGLGAIKGVVRPNRAIGLKARKEGTFEQHFFDIASVSGVKLISALWKRCSLGCFLIRLDRIVPRYFALYR